jgi:hypothetical protein
MYLLQALELQRQQEMTKQAEAKTKEAEFKAQASAYAKVTNSQGTARCICLGCMLPVAEHAQI